ncbi:hypothetical protein V8F20_001333 [Naviculisporaceae sp. PSN 640]
MKYAELTLDPDGDLWVMFSCSSNDPAAKTTNPKPAAPENNSNVEEPETNRPGTSENSDADDSRSSDEEAKDVRIKMRVCSKILIMVSPVFRKMLTGEFKEAVDFRASKASSPSPASIYTLELHEDSAEAAIVLFSSLHHCDVDPVLLGDPFILEDLALICDKYQCDKAMRLRGELLIREKLDHVQDWLSRQNPNAPKDIMTMRHFRGNLTKALILAYALRLPKQFMELGWYLFVLEPGNLDPGHGCTRLLVANPIFGQVDVAGYLQERLDRAKLNPNIDRRWQDLVCLNCLKPDEEMNWTCEVCRKDT